MTPVMRCHHREVKLLDDHTITLYSQAVKVSDNFEITVVVDWPQLQRWIESKFFPGIERKYVESRIEEKTRVL